MSAPDARQTGTDGRAELTSVLLLAGAVLIAAGAVSFTHVKDWTMANSPVGTREWVGWVNAVISEIVPLTCIIAIRLLLKWGRPIWYAAVLMLAAAGFSLTVQIAVAKDSFAGRVASAVPAVAFLLLGKLALTVITSRPRPKSGAALSATPIRTARSGPADSAGQDSPPGDVRQQDSAGARPADAGQDSGADPHDRTTDRSAGDSPRQDSASSRSRLPAETGQEQRPQPRTGRPAASAVEVPGGEAAEVADLLPVGRRIAAELAAAGRALSRPTLVEALREREVPISTGKAAVLTRVLKAEQAAAALTGDEEDPADGRDSSTGSGQDRSPVEVSPGGRDRPAGDGRDSDEPAEDGVGG